MPFVAWSLGWRVPLSWLIALGCIALAWRRFGMTERLCPPSVSTLLDELTGDLGSERGGSGEPQRFAIAELNQRLSDVSFALGLLPSTFTALIRISLASGSALALLGFTEVGSGRLPLDTALRAGLCAVSGLVGAGVVAAIGRSAKRRSSELRLEWDRVSRELGKQLGTSLEQASHVAEREPRQK